MATSWMVRPKGAGVTRHFPPASTRVVKIVELPSPEEVEAERKAEVVKEALEGSLGTLEEGMRGPPRW